MSKERRTNIPIEEKIRAAQETAILKSQDLITGPEFKRFDNFMGEDGSLIGQFTEALIRHQIVLFYGTEIYEEHMQKATQTASFIRPFGIEMSTLSHDAKLVLYPKMIFKADKEVEQMAKEEGLKVASNGPQAMVYILDGFADRKVTPQDFNANFFIFIPYLTNSLIYGKYPLEEGERSTEFKERIKEAFSLISEYVKSLDEESKENLSSNIEALENLDDAALEKHAENFTRYQTEPIKPMGLVESPIEYKDETPKQAIENKTEYLHNSERNLPERKVYKDTPRFPWYEYGTNKWDRDGVLFGRYEMFTLNLSKTIRVDFKLDSRFFPAKYGFFHTIEITHLSPIGLKEHIILGQEAGHPLDPGSVYPVALAGDYDFTDDETEVDLELLANDKGTKHEVASVLKDVIDLSRKGKLKRIDKK